MEIISLWPRDLPLHELFNSGANENDEYEDENENDQV
jgi:hypothetical protein